MERDVIGFESVFAVEFGDEEVLRDVCFFVFGITGDLDDLHAVAKRRGDGVELVGGSNKKHLGEIEGDFEVVIGEAVVLFRVKDFEQGGGGVAAKIVAEFIDLIEDKDGVVAFGFFDALDDPTGERANVGASMPTDLGFIFDATEGDADKLPSHGTGDGFTERGFADAGGADEAQDRAAHIIFELTHSEVFEDAAFDFVEAVMVFVEDLAGVRDIEAIFGGDIPRKLGHPFDIGAGDGVFGGLWGDTREATEFFEGFFFDIGGHTGFFDESSEFVDFLHLIVFFAEFFFDGFELFA